MNLYHTTDHFWIGAQCNPSKRGVASKIPFTPNFKEWRCFVLKDLHVAILERRYLKAPLYPKNCTSPVFAIERDECEITLDPIEAVQVWFRVQFPALFLKIACHYQKYLIQEMCGDHQTSFWKPEERDSGKAIYVSHEPPISKEVASNKKLQQPPEGWLVPRDYDGTEEWPGPGKCLTTYYKELSRHPFKMENWERAWSCGITNQKPPWL